MRILACHNYYQQPGGEDQVFADETGLLESRGHTVIRFTRHNDAIEGMSSWQVARRTLWNSQTAHELRELVRRERPNVAHFTNTFPLISPAAYYAVRKAGVPIVQSLHNYRLLCPNSYFLRDGATCEDCLGKLFAWPAIRHACYRNNRKATAVVAAMQTFHRLLGSWSRKVDVFCALTEFAREKFIEGGLPADKIVVKPNFMPSDPGPGTGRGGNAVFVGRLSSEKGIDTLLTAWTKFSNEMPLTLIGDGPLADRVQEAVRENPRISWLGRQPTEQVLTEIGRASCLVLPSVCYEGFPKTIVEAFAKGTPVVASDLGSMRELISDGVNGSLFAAGDAEKLASTVCRLQERPQLLAAMRSNARAEFEEKFTAAANYDMLMALYERAIGADESRSLVTTDSSDR